MEGKVSKRSITRAIEGFCRAAGKQMTRYLLITALLIHLFTPASIVHAAEQPHRHHNFPPAVTGFHDVMAPLWHSQAGDERNRRICEQQNDLEKHAENILSEQSPQGVDADQWKTIAGNLRNGVQEIGSRCADNMSAEQALADVHNIFHDLVRLVGHRH
jgi:hypothetical protein